MGVSYVSEDPVRNRKSPPLPVFGTDLSPACNNKKTRRRSNEDDSPLLTGTPLFDELVETIESAHFEDSHSYKT
jgi:hypothetical protein